MKDKIIKDIKTKIPEIHKSDLDYITDIINEPIDYAIEKHDRGTTITLKYGNKTYTYIDILESSILIHYFDKGTHEGGRGTVRHGYGIQ